MRRTSMPTLAAQVVAVVGLAALARGQTTPPQACVDSCDIGRQVNDYSKYSVSAAVKANVPEEDFPRKGESDAWEPYAISSVTNSVILILFCCLSCCCLCCYVWRMKTRLDHPVDSCCCCFPGSPHEGWATGNWRRLAWAMLIVVCTAWFILLVLAFQYNTQLSDSVRDIPLVLNTYAEYLEGPVSSDVECVIGRATAVSEAADDLLADPSITSNATAETIVREIKYHVGNFTDVLNNTEDGILKGVDDAAQQIRDGADTSKEWTNKAGDQMEAFVYSAFSLILLVGLGNILLGCFVANGKGARKHCTCTLASCAAVMVCVMWVLFLICAIVLFVLRFEAGFCEAPIAILESYVATSNRSDAATYYLTCANMNQTERDIHWPFRSEQIETSQEYTQILGNVGQLEGTGADLTELKSSVRTLGCSITADVGLLGYNGIFSCGVMDRFLQSVIIQFCDTMYSPLYSLYLCTLLLAFLMIITVYVQTIVRRERDGGDDQDFEYDSPSPGTTMSPIDPFTGTVKKGPESPNPAYDPNHAHLADRGPPPDDTPPPSYSDSGE